MKRNKTYKLRIYPTQDQEVLINKTFGACRMIYNAVLDYKQNLYNDRKQTFSKVDSIKSITEIKKINGYEWLKEIETVALQQSLIDLDKSYQNFFRNLKKGKKTFLRFKSKHNPKQSYRTNNVSNTIRVENNKIRLPKLKWVKFRDSRQLKENEIIKFVTIKKTPTGKYFACVLVEYEFEPNKPTQIDTSRIFSADMSAKNFMITTDDIEIENQKFYRKLERLLGIRQRRLSRKKNGSNNRLKAKHRLARIHEDISNRRFGWHKNVAHKLLTQFDVLCFEDLNIEAMKRFHKGLAKTMSDMGWSAFLTFLEQKCEAENKYLIKISRWFPSSKMCSECGCLKKDLPLSQRTYECDCGSVIDRDENAAKNIKAEGINLLLEKFKGIELLTHSKGINLSNSTARYVESNACEVMSSGYTLSPGNYNVYDNLLVMGV